MGVCASSRTLASQPPKSGNPVNWQLQPGRQLHASMLWTVMCRGAPWPEATEAEPAVVCPIRYLQRPLWARHRPPPDRAANMRGDTRSRKSRVTFPAVTERLYYTDAYCTVFD